MTQTTVNIATRDGSCPTSVFTPDRGEGPWPAAIFYMDGPGIRPLLFEMGQRLADLGYVVLLPDMFYRAGPYDPVDPTTLFSDPEKRAAHGRLFASIDKARAVSDTEAFLAYLDTRTDVRGKKVGVTGYCMGGGIVLAVAAAFPERIAAAASFHGGGLATDAEDSPHKGAARIKAKVLVAGADKDRGFPPEQAERLAAAFKEAGLDHRVEIWEGAIHGWTMKDISIYNEAAAERHWRELEALFAEALA